MQHQEKLDLQDLVHRVKEETAKNNKNGWKPENQDRKLGEDFDINQAFFLRPIFPENDKCDVDERTHIGVPLINEQRERYDWRAWIVPPKATPLEGGAAKSAPQVSS